MATSSVDLDIEIFKQLIFYCLVIVLLFYLIYDAFGETNRLVSVAGMLTFIFLGFFSSKHPNEIKWRTVLMGIFVQISMGMLTMRWDFGRSVFLCIGNRTETFLRFGYEGAAFAFGNYIVHELHVFAFMSLSVIYFMGMIIEILFYLGWIQKMCFNLGWAIQKILGTTIIESVNSVTTVFLGMSEAPLLYRPYIKDLTKSELHAVMAGGFSTVAGTVFAAYTALGVNPALLITASIMAAPAGLCYAKLLYPETEVSKTTPKNFVYYKSEERGIIDAACKGAISGINIIAGVIATVIASVSLVAFFSSALQWFAGLVGVEGFTFQVLVGKILWPIPYIMGVKPEQCEHVAKLIGIKLSLNEFIAYEELGKMKKIGLLTPRSEAMATFALCSFANPGSLACFIAVLVSLCPNQKQNIGRVALRALISGATTSLLTACVAGMLMPEAGFGDLGCTDCNRTTYTVV